MNSGNKNAIGSGTSTCRARKNSIAGRTVPTPTKDRTITLES